MRPATRLPWPCRVAPAVTICGRRRLGLVAGSVLPARRAVKPLRAATLHRTMPLPADCASPNVPCRPIPRPGGPFASLAVGVETAGR